MFKILIMILFSIVAFIDVLSLWLITLFYNNVKTYQSINITICEEITIRIFSANQSLNLEKKNPLVAKIFENICSYDFETSSSIFL